MTSVACAPWRIAWAERENERRQRAYRDASDAWQRRDDHLARLRVEAAGFLGCTQPRTGLPVDLADDELVFRVLPVATLVEAEARHVPGLPTPGGACSYADAWSEALPPGLRAVDTGMAVVTSHRVAFGGREHRREWRYADLVGPAHHPDTPFTLLPDHSRLSGLLVPANAVVNFRFYLTLAVATDRTAVLAQVDALLAAHRAARPAPIVLAEPDDAPLTAVRPDRRALGAAAIAAVVFATVGPGALGPRSSGVELPVSVQRAEIAALDVPRVAPVALPPVGPVAPRSRVGTAASAVWSPPHTPAVRPSTAAAVSRAVSPAVTVAEAPAVTPSAVPAPSPTSAPTPGPTTEPSTSPVPTPPVASTSPTPTPTETPSPNSLLAVCLDPLQLPLLDPLLCPPPTP
ncbi:hypothetical protein O7631_10375 [Micromonospora sp. WMMD967]|uniref:hypothetical protein n=1 Tax=Micromonospora sp. WMMD967 TaxID=3016101 RepID=UPI002415BE15|nr:hypothetical protein [Micromonospora sp. WMMD967]MDG4836921.1 hypothetical protein [Micromonospora sp. WMMD967]